MATASVLGAASRAELISNVRSRSSPHANKLIQLGEMDATILRCAALWIMGLCCTARADPVVQGLVVASLGIGIVGEALDKAPSHEDRATSSGSSSP